MGQKLQRWFTHNLLLKVIALVMAILLWLAFSNADDPIVQASFTIPVEVEHLDEFRSENHYIDLEGDDDLSNLNLEVYIRARNKVVQDLQSRPATSFLRAYVDVYELNESNNNRLMIHYEVKDKRYMKEIQFYDLKNKSYYEANVDDNITKEIEVRYEIQGSPDKNYMYVPGESGIQVNPETITLTGPASQIEKISYGKVTIRIDGVTENVNKKGDIALYDEDNTQIVNYSRDIIKASSSVASVFVPIYMVKTVPLQPYLTGDVPEGYEYGRDIALSVPEVTIYGPESTVNKITSIELPKVDMSNLTSDFSMDYDLNTVLQSLYPKGTVRLTEKNETTVTLTFTVGEQKSTSVTIDTSKVTIYGQRNGWNCQFTNPTIDLQLVGLARNIRKFDPSSLVISVRLTESDLTEGKHMVTLDVSGLGELSLKDKETKVEVMLTPKS